MRARETRVLVGKFKALAMDTVLTCYACHYVNVSEKRGHSAPKIYFQLAVPTDSTKPAL